MDIFELIKKNEEAPTPESLRKMSELIPGSVKEIKLKKKNQSAFSINKEAITKWKKKNKKSTLLTKE